MIERELRVAVGEQTMRVFLTRPEQRRTEARGPKLNQEQQQHQQQHHQQPIPQTQRFPLTILLMDAPGYRPELQLMARRLATAGYAVAVPDLYYRSVAELNLAAPADLDPARPDYREIVYRHMHALARRSVDTGSSVAVDVRALLAAAGDDPAIDTARLGVFGYCMSGPVALQLACDMPDRVYAAASIHGVRLCHQGADSPHRLLRASAAEVQAELYIGCAEQDDWASPELMATLAETLSSGGLRFQLDWYPNTQHGFVFPARDGIYQAVAAERHWAALINLFRRRLDRQQAQG